nr:probable peptidyl-tRNA hydrolase 2 [Leptinotarsa decemlineata]
MSESWEPNEDFLHELVSMGISLEKANEALFVTENVSLDRAVQYIFRDHGEPENFSSTPQTSEEEHEHRESHETIPQSVSNETGPQSDEDESSDEEEEQYYKMSFVVNMSLRMGVGKIAAQVGHACLGLYQDLIRHNEQKSLERWENMGEKKIVLKGNDDVHLKELLEKAKDFHIPCYLVEDGGLTQIPPGSVTVLSLFGLEDEINKLTKNLSLL